MPSLFESSITRTASSLKNWQEALPPAVHSVSISASRFHSTMKSTSSAAASARGLAVISNAVEVSQADMPTFRAEWTSRKEAAQHVEELWKSFVIEKHAPVDTDSVAETIDRVFQMAYRFGPSSVDFRGMDSSKVNGEHLAAALRAASSFKHLALGWSNALRVAKEAILVEGGDPSDSLLGMIEA
jgi:hypothetical protein